MEFNLSIVLNQIQTPKKQVHFTQSEFQTKSNNQKLNSSLSTAILHLFFNLTVFFLMVKCGGSKFLYATALYIIVFSVH